MFSKIAQFCIRERLLVLLATAVVVIYGWYCTNSVPMDAIPNVSDNQVIVLTTWNGRSPKDVEDQITYPLSVALQSVPGARSVRGKSMFGFSFVQVTFDDNVDLYWARSRVAEQLNTVAGKLPQGVTPELGPDATALGQIFYYVLQGPPDMDLAELRSLQDFVIKYALESINEVAEVASVGGYVRQYQIELDPDKLRFFNVTLRQVIQAVRQSNIDVGAKTVEVGGMEHILRGRGFIGSGKTLPETLHEIEQTVVATRDGVPVRIKDLGQVQLGPEFRRGAIDLNGSEAVGGVVVMRLGENPRHVIQKVREKIKQLEPNLGGVKIVPVYDRTWLIDETVATLTTALKEEIIITILVVVLFLLHIRASIVVASTLPVAVLMAFIGMKWFNVDANIMSLAGIAIAIGTMVDMGIIVSENIYRHLAEWEARGGRDREERLRVIYEAAVEVIPAVITGVSTTVISFLPIFFLSGRDHRLFSPLAWTKTFSLVASLIVAVTLVPLLSRIFFARLGDRPWFKWAGGAVGLALALALVGLVWQPMLAAYGTWAVVAAWVGGAALGAFAGYWIVGERVKPLEQNPISRAILFVYQPTLRWLLHHKGLFVLLLLLILFLGGAAWWGFPVMLKPLEQLASSVGADLNELPGYVEFKHLHDGLKTDDWIALDEGSWFYMPMLYPAASFSEAMRVLQLQDTLIKQIPEVENVLGKIGRVESALDPAPAAMIETYVMLKPRDQWRPGVTAQDIWNEINRVATLPGITKASPLQPIEGRVVMLQSGIRASMAVRIYGDDLQGLTRAAEAVSEFLQNHPYVDGSVVKPDIVVGKPYIEFEVDREEAARYQMTVSMVNELVEAGLGGMNVTTTVEGRERYPIQVRFLKAFRQAPEDLGKLPVVTPTGDVVPLERLTKIQSIWGPGAIQSENARLVAHVSFSPREGRGDLETAMAVKSSIERAIAEGKLKLPQGFVPELVGSFQNQVETNRRLVFIILPAVLLINLLLIYMQFRRLSTSLIVFSGIPIAFSGGMIALALGQVEMNTAVWVGFIALFGIAVDDGVVMATYLSQLFARRKPRTLQEIRETTIEAGSKRIRPCLMTTFTTLIALVPVLVSTGRGADVARAMALPVFGGMVVELVTLFIAPVSYCWIEEFLLQVSRRRVNEPAAEPVAAPLAGAPGT